MFEAQKKRFVNATELESKFQKKVQSYAGTLAAIAYNSALETIKEAPTVDAVEVVRCKNCVYFQTQANDWGYGFTVYNKEHGGMLDPCPDDFCSYGERRCKE